MVIPLGNEAKPRITPWATYLLIAVNLVCFAVEQVKPLSFLIAHAATPYEITNDVDIFEPFTYQIEPTPDGDSDLGDESGVFVHQARGPSPIRLTLISSLFLHANLIHLGGNILFLFLFGRRIEEAFGRLLYLGFYLGCGVFGTLTEVAATPESLTPIIGASGAIAGVMGAYLVWFPRDRVRVLVFNVLVLVPASGVIGVWIALQLLRGYFLFGAVAQAGQVAYLSHLGGAAMGIVGSLPIYFLSSKNPVKSTTLENNNSNFRGAAPDHDGHSSP